MKRVLVFLVILCGYCICAWSQGELFFTSDKLSNTNITSICQDKDGYIWIGTENGLNRFDGYKFTVYKNDPQDTTSLMFNIVNKVFCDRSGNLGVGTNTGVQRYDGISDSFVRYDSPEFERARISDICQMPDGRVLVGTAGFGLFQADAASHTLTLHMLVITRGKLDQKELIGDKEQQEAILARKDAEMGGEYKLAIAHVEGIAPCHWHNLRLRFEGDTITGYVDGKQVLQAKSDRYPNGMAGLMAPMQQHRISTPYFDNLKIIPIL